MDTNAIVLKTRNHDILLTENEETNGKHRLSLFSRWLDDTGQHWHQPDLGAYRDYLLTGYRGRDGKPLAPASVRAHLATVRGRYARLVDDNTVRELLYSLAPAAASASDRKAFVDEVITRLQNVIQPAAAPVTVITKQDTPDGDHLRLTKNQADALLAAPGTDTSQGLRDTAIIALMLCTGVREAELCALDVADLRQHYGGALSLRVRDGKGAKARMIPYGDLDFALVIVDAWLRAAGIAAGAVFRGFHKGAKRVRPTRLTVRAINQILERYPLIIQGELRTVNPHDLRRTYARRLYEAGVDLVALQQNLGHADSKTTLTYIGKLDASARKPPAVYTFDLSRLKRVLL